MKLPFEPPLESPEVFIPSAIHCDRCRDEIIGDMILCTDKHKYCSEDCLVSNEGIKVRRYDVERVIDSERAYERGQD